MKKNVCLLLALVLAISLLCGCSGLLQDQTVSCGDLSITLPGHFMDMSDQDFAQDLELVYGTPNAAVSVSKESIDSLTAYLPETDTLAYAELLIEVYGLNGSVETIDGIPCFTYVMDADGTEFTYLVGIFASDTDYWMVQAYCPSENYAEKQSDLWRYISSVTIN